MTVKVFKTKPHIKFDIKSNLYLCTYHGYTATGDTMAMSYRVLHEHLARLEVSA